MGRKQAELRFYAELNDFLPLARRGRPFIYGFELPASLKDVVESVGVPHAEVDLIVVNGEPAAPTRLVRDGDRISVYPVFESIDISGSEAMHPRPLRQTRFVLDVNLGRLARLLRLFGFDSSYRNDATDEHLASTAGIEGRVLLTRDVALLKRSAVTRGYFVRAVEPRRQLVEVLDRFDLFGSAAPFTRCLRCNGRLVPVSKDGVVDRLPRATARLVEEFSVCEACERVYWEGSHHARMSAFVEEVLRTALTE